MELGNQIFPPSLPAADPTALQLLNKTTGPAGTGNRPLPTDLHTVNRKRVETLRQTTTNRLNFWKFRQGPQAGSSSASAKLLVLMPPSEPEMPL
jgi:hypothetical protein